MRILLVDDDNLSRRSISKFLGTYLNHDVDEADSGPRALEFYQKNPYPLVISDIRMPGISGLDLLTKINELDTEHETQTILITGFGELETAIKALRLGAYDFLEKPVNVDVLAEIIERIEKQEQSGKMPRNLEQAAKTSRSAGTSPHDFSYQDGQYIKVFGCGTVGVFSNKFRSIVELTKKYHSGREIPVLIKGDTGTGKEIVARLSHAQESENLKPFITINCSAISPNLFESELFGYESGAFTGAHTKGQIGKLELAQGGTIFLDEIGDLPLDLQPKLLTALQMKEFYRMGGKQTVKLDVRFICATNRDIDTMIAEGSFRRDLYYRLNTGYVEIPSLIERKEEIPALARMFLTEFSIQKKKKFRIVHPETLSILLKQDWPGNIRELKNVVERAVLLNDSIDLLPEHLDFLDIIPQNKSDSGTDLLCIPLAKEQYDYAQLEKEIITQLLKHFDGNKSKCAKFLKITRNRLNRKLAH